MQSKLDSPVIPYITLDYRVWVQPWNKTTFSLNDSLEKVCHTLNLIIACPPPLSLSLPCLSAYIRIQLYPEVLKWYLLFFWCSDVCCVWPNAHAMFTTTFSTPILWGRDFFNTEVMEQGLFCTWLLQGAYFFWLHKSRGAVVFAWKNHKTQSFFALKYHRA